VGILETVLDLSGCIGSIYSFVKAPYTSMIVHSPVDFGYKICKSIKNYPLFPLNQGQIAILIFSQAIFLSVQ
jgi:hypothetical protein